MCIYDVNDTAPAGIYTLSLHDALPISHGISKVPPAAPPGDDEAAAGDAEAGFADAGTATNPASASPAAASSDRKSTRLNSSHGYISYAVFCLKKKKHTVSLFTRMCSST